MSFEERPLIDLSPELWTLPIGWDLRYLPSTTSTNDDAKRAAVEGAVSRTVVLADEQTRGRGRRGRGWLAPSGSSLLFSLLLREELDPLELTRVGAVAVAQSIARETGLAAQVKWPNDVMIGSGKVCGILTESLADGTAIVGIGVNVNLDPQAAGLPPSATSLSAELGHPLVRSNLLTAVLTSIDEYLGLPPDVSRDVVFDLWRELLWRSSQVVELRNEGARLQGVIEDVTRAGALLIRTTGGELREITTGELLID